MRTFHQVAWRWPGLSLACPPLHEEKSYGRLLKTKKYEVVQSRILLIFTVFSAPESVHDTRPIGNATVQYTVYYLVRKMGHHKYLSVRVCVCVCVCEFIKLHMTAQSGLVILIIVCHSR